jgi:hypothetical protein
MHHALPQDQGLDVSPRADACTRITPVRCLRLQPPRPRPLCVPAGTVCVTCGSAGDAGGGGPTAHWHAACAAGGC